MKICQIPHVILQTTSQFFFLFRSNIRHFARKVPIKGQIFQTFESSDQNSPNSCHFWNNKSVFLQILHHSVYIYIIPLYFFGWNVILFEQKEPIKVQIWWNFTWTVKSLKLCTLIDSFCKNRIKFQLKKYRRVSLMTLKTDAKFKEKLTCCLTWGIWWNFTQTLKGLKISLWWAIFVQSIWSLS